MLFLLDQKTNISKFNCVLGFSGQRTIIPKIKANTLQAALPDERSINMRILPIVHSPEKLNLPIGSEEMSHRQRPDIQTGYFPVGKIVFKNRVSLLSEKKNKKCSIHI